MQEIQNHDCKNAELRKELTLIEARYNAYRIKQNKKILSNEELEIMRNQLNQTVVEFSERMSYFNKEKKSSGRKLYIFNNYGFILFCVLFGMFVAIMKYLIKIL